MVYLTIAGIAVVVILICGCHARCAHWFFRGRKQAREAKEHVDNEKARLDDLEAVVDDNSWKLDRLIAKLLAQRTIGQIDVAEISAGKSGKMADLVIWGPEE